MPRSLGALKADLEPLGSEQGSCFIHCWKDVECIYNHCVQQQHLHPIPISKHTTRGVHQRGPAKKTTTARGDLKTGFSWEFCTGLGVRLWCHPSGTSSGEAPEAGQDEEGAGVRGFQQQGTEPRLDCSLGGLFCIILTHLQNHIDGQHFGAFSAQMIFKLLR